MNLDSLSFTLSQISFLVANLSKKNFKQSAQELANLVQLYGLEADRHLLQCLFSHVDFSLEGSKTSNSKDCLQTQLLIQECASLLSKPTLVSLLCYAFEHPLHQQKTLKPNANLFPQLRKLLKLTPVQEVVFGLALLQSENIEFEKLASQFVRQKLPELIASYVDAEGIRQQEGGLHDTTPEVLYLILTSLATETVSVNADIQKVFWKRLQRDFPREHVPVVLSPLLYPECPDLPMDKQQDAGTAKMDTSLANLVPDVGVAFTSSTENCKSMIVNLSGGEPSAVVVAHTITGMLRSPPIDPKHPNFFEKGDKSGAGGSDLQWNMEVFVLAVKELQPNMSWRDVLMELDNPKFLLKDRNSFLLLFSGICHMFDRIQFPVEVIYRRWNNTDGQYSLIVQILKNPETLSFADLPYHPVPVDLLKASPDSDNKELATWRSLDLIEILLYLSERGLYPQVLDVFKFPIQHCPDVLMLGLLQNPPPLSVLCQELISLLLPTFLGMHPNSGIILHHAWNTQLLIHSVRPIVMNAMADWYMRSDNDQAKLSRILDIAQDLKALTLILSSQTFPFVIDLACLASRRGYLKLDKWLTDKIREHGETFIAPCVKFLQRRCPQIAGGVKDDALSKVAQLPQDTLTTILGCLQVCAPNVSQELSETIMSMVQNCSLLLNKNRQQPPGVLRHRTLDAAFSAFPSPQLDPITSLSSNLAGINIVPGMSGGLGSIVSTTPGSPSRMMNSSQSPFISGYIAATALQHTAVATTGQVPNVNLNLSRGPAGGGEKPGVVNNIFGEPNLLLTKEVEDEANSYFQRIYNHQPLPTLSIEDFLDMLKRFMESSKQRDREVFTCMVKNLMEEYKFFPQYPDKELQVTAQLFGGIIERGLVPTYMVLGLALRFVLEALRKPVGSKMYYFGIAALDRFKSKLKDYQKYCEHVANIPHFGEFPAHLIEYVEYGLQSQEPPNRPQGPVMPPQLAVMLQQQQALPLTTALKATPTTTLTTTTTISKVTTSNTLPARPSIANATNIDTLLIAQEKEEKITPPPEALQDKIGFIFNNLSQLNLQAKCDELRDLVCKEHWLWMSQYMVLKRATIEFNFHLLYSNFLDTLKIHELTKLVVKETYRNIRVLLRSDKGIANFSDRSLLKNLGHWLGMLTLARNKPILMIDIDLKSLIIEAYAKGQQELLYVIPFVAKVMESCAKGKVFKPKNPWTMAIMNLLAELHREPNLKLNLKFEIEVLCKSLDIDLTKLTPTTLLKDPKKLESLEQQLSKPEEEHASTPPVPQQAPPSVFASVPKPSLLPSADEMQQVVTSTQLVAASVSQLPSAGTPNPTLPPPVEPRFHVTDINVASVSNLAPHLIVPQLNIFQTHPHLKALVRSAVERAVQEWIGPVMDRSIKIAASTAENIVRRDFSVDPDENRMRIAAHTFVRCLTGSMAMITCRDHMLASMSTNLKNSFTAALQGNAKQQLDLAEAAASSIAEANMELACAFIQKAAMEKAVPEMDKRLSEEYEVRKIARSEGRRYCDPAMLTYQAERMAEPIRHAVGGVANHRFNSVYGECAKTIPGFRPPTDRELAFYKPTVEALPSSVFSSVTPFTPEDDTGALFDKLVTDVEMYLQAALSSGLLPGSNPRLVALHSLRETANHARRSRVPTSAVTVVQKAVEGLLEGISPREDPEMMIRYRDAHLRVLKTFQESRSFGAQWTIKNVTCCLAEAREEIRYNLEAFDCLVRSGLVSMSQYDTFLAQSLETAVNYHALMFAIQLVQTYLIDERMNSLVSEGDLQHTVNVLTSIHNLSREAHPGLGSVLEMLRAAQDPTALTDMPSAGPISFIHSGILQARSRDFEDSLPEKTEFLLREWVTAFTVNNREQSKTFNYLVHQMNFHGILKSDDLVAKFLRISAELCIQTCSRASPEHQAARLKCYHTLDAFVRLIYLLFKHTGDQTSVSSKLTLLNKTLGIITGLLVFEHDNRSNEFNQMPYERLYIMLFVELNQPEAFLEPINFQILTSFCHVLYLIRPTKAPKFAYAWLELISHRAFLTRIMALTAQQKVGRGWPMYSQLLTALFKFLAPFLRNTDLPKPVAVLYRGTLRVLLVLLHDFPEFLCDYHYGFCDVIPSNCIQMRNLILSAFPRNMRLPDPFTPNLKVDILQEIASPPRIVANVAAMITPPTFRKDLDSYLQQRSPVTFLSELRSNLQVACEAGMNYNTQLMNALVLYVGNQAIQYIRGKGLSPNMSTIASSAHMDIFQNLGVDLDTEGRYLFLNAIANQLRYPNSHTHYFSCLLLSLFSESNTESIQEQITRVLLERLIVNRPHPWGLLITFIELIKNPIYKFWTHEFVRCAPEIEKLFESVARSCMVSKQVNQQNDSETGEPLAV